MITLEYIDLEVDYRDSGPWRSYELSTYGNTVQELIDNATISEIDQNGGEITCYGYGDASLAVGYAVEYVCEQQYNKLFSTKFKKELFK